MVMRPTPNLRTRLSGVRPQTHLVDANYWEEAQAAFLNQALEEGADWSGIVDQLDVRLRG